MELGARGCRTALRRRRAECRDRPGRALTRNPRLEILLINGIYDLATPYFAAVWTLDNLNLPPDQRDNIQRADFAAGHMMYVDESLLDQWRETLVSFLARTSGRSGVARGGVSTAASSGK